MNVMWSDCALSQSVLADTRNECLREGFPFLLKLLM